MKPEFILKNLASLGINSSVSLMFPLDHLQDKNDVRSLADIADKLFIRDIFLKGNILKTKSAQNAVQSGNMKKLKLYFEYTPDIRAYLADHPDQLKLLIKRHIFSTKEYAQSVNSWNTSLTHFFGREPEIVDFTSEKQRGRLYLENPENILAVFIIKTRQNETVVSEDISGFLDKKSGLVILPVRLRAVKQLFIFRNYQLRLHDHISQCFNYYNLSHARMMQEIFSVKLKKYFPEYEGLFLNLDTVFESGSKASWPEYDINLEKLAPGLLSSIANSWLNRNDDWEADYNLARKEFFANELKKDLSKMTEHFSCILPIDHAITSRAELSASYIPEIDARQFIPGTPYFFHGLLQMKRLVNRRHLQGDKTAPVVIHNILNCRFSFAEKKSHLDYLSSVGVNHFYFKYSDPADNNPTNNLERLNDKDNEIFYLPDWLSPFHQTGHFFKRSSPHSNILALYPIYDLEHDDFKRVLQAINEHNLDYTFIDFDLFNSDDICRHQDKHLVCQDHLFSIVLLPSINILPVPTLKKLEAFINKGGIVLALGSLPVACNDLNGQKMFNRIKENIWFEGSEPGGTSFKKHDSGGLGLYQKDLTKLNSLWDELEPFLQFQIKMYQGSVRHILQEGDDKYYLFLFNDGEMENRCEIQSAFFCRPHIWDFDKAESYTYPFWYTDEKRMYITINMAPGESRLFLLNKDDSVNVCQLVFSDFDGARTVRQDKKSIALEGWRRKSGDQEIIIRNGQTTKRINTTTPDKLLILRVNSKGWYLESKSYKGKVNLGDHGKLYPFQSASLTYHKIIVMDKKYTGDYQLFLDLGKVKDWCILHINDKYVGRLFSAPFIFDVTGILQKGENKLSITVFNTLSNQLARTSDSFPLREYGMFGPVKITPYGKISVNYEFE